MDPLKNPFGRPPPSTSRYPAGPPPSNGIHPVPQPGPSQNISQVAMGPVDPIGALLWRAHQLPRRMLPPSHPGLAALQKRIESTQMYCQPGTSIGPLCQPSAAVANFRPPRAHSELSKETRIYADSYRFADDPLWTMVANGEKKEENDEEKKFWTIFGACSPPKIRPTIDLDTAFHKEMIHLGKVEKKHVREDLYNHRDLIFHFLGDVTDLRRYGNRDYEDRVIAINGHISKRIVKFHPLYDLNQSEDVLPKEDLKYLEENDNHLYRIMHRIFAPEMGSLEQPKYKPFAQIVEDETWRKKCSRLRAQMEDVFGNFEKMKIHTGDKEKGQEIQQAVIEGLTGEVEPKTLERMVEEDVLSVEQLGAAFRKMEIPASEPEVVRDDLENPMEAVTPEQREELEALYIPEEEFAAFRISEKGQHQADLAVYPPEASGLEILPVAAGQSAPEPANVAMEEDHPVTTPIQPAVVHPGPILLDFEEMYPNGLPMDQEYPETSGQSAEIQPIRGDSGYDDREPEIIILETPPPSLKSCLKQQPGLQYSDIDVYSMNNSNRMAYAHFYAALPKKRVQFKEAYDNKVRLFCNNEPHRLIQECWQSVQKAKNIQEPLYFPADYKFNPPEFRGSQYPWTVACEIDYRIYRTKFFPEMRRTAHSGPKNEQQARENPGRFLYLTSRLRTVAFRFDDPLLKTHILPAHEGKREKNPATVPKEHKKMSAYLLEQYKKLIRFGHFWAPIQVTSLRSCETAYNHCYGAMVISDSLLEEAEPQYLLNAGLFAFPPPLGVREINELLENITVREYGIRDIVLVWGLDVLLHKEPEIAVAKLFSLYQSMKQIMEGKLAIYHKQGYHRLMPPRFWMTTLPISPTIDSGMEKFNRMLKQVAEIYNIPVIDWAAEFSRQHGVVTERNAEKQLEVLYELLHEKVDIIQYRSAADIQRDRKSGKEFINCWEFEQDQKRIRQEIEKQKEEQKRKNEPVQRKHVRIRPRFD